MAFCHLRDKPHQTTHLLLETTLGPKVRLPARGGQWATLGYLVPSLPTGGLGPGGGGRGRVLVLGGGGTPDPLNLGAGGLHASPAWVCALG